MADGTTKVSIPVETPGAEKAARDLKKVGAAASTAADKGSLLGDALGKLKGVGGPVGDIASKMDDLRGKASEASGSLKTFTSALDGVKGRAVITGVAVGTLAVAFAGLAGVGAALSFAGALDDLGDMAEAFGLSASQIALMSTAASNAGSSLDTVISTIARAGDAAYKSKDAFAVLGIKTKDSNGQLKSASALALETINAYERMGGSTEALAAAQEILSRAFLKEKEAIKAVAAAQEYANEQFNKGIGINAAGSKAASDYESAMGKVKFTMQVLGSDLVASVIPAFTALADAFVKSYESGGLVATAVVALKGSVEAVMAVISALVNIVQILDFAFRSVADTIASVLVATVEAMQGNFNIAAIILKQLRNRVVTDFKGMLDEVKKTWAGFGKSFDGGIDAPKPGALDNGGGKPKPGSEKDKPDPNQAARDAITRFRENQEITLQALNDELGMSEKRYRLQVAFADLQAKDTDLTNERKISERAEFNTLTAAIEVKEKAKKFDEEVNRLLEKRQELLDSINQRSGEALGKLRNKLSEPLKTNAQRDADSARESVLGGYDARINTVNNALKYEKDAAKIASYRLELESLSKARSDASAQLETEISNAQSMADDLGYGIQTGLIAVINQLPTASQAAAQGVQVLSRGLEDGLFTLFTTGKLDMESFFSSLLSQLLKIYIQLAIIKPMMLSLTNAGVLSQVFADGGAIEGGVQKFASGGIVNRPTIFPMKNGMGLMGEAGAEAVMPLKRTAAGRLGVEVSGKSGSGSVVINNNITVQGQDNSQNAAAVTSEVMKAMKGVARQQIAEARRIGGSLNPI